MKSLFKLGVTIAIVVISIDQLTKIWALNALVLHQPEALFAGLNMTLVYNSGMAFSMFDESGDVGRWLLSGLAIVISVVLLVWLWRLHHSERLLAVALGFVLGGAVGNVIDRIQLGYVVDFVDVYYQTWHWPAFNVADSAITLGAILLLWDTFFGKHEGAEKHNNDD